LNGNRWVAAIGAGSGSGSSMFEFELAGLTIMQTFPKKQKDALCKGI
jgi:hypothetical protein